MFARIGGFVVLLARFLLPFVNRTKSEKVGSWLTAILIVLLGIGYALPALQGDDVGDPPAIEAPAPADVLPLPDVPTPDDLGPLAALGRGAGFVLSLSPVGCSSSQQAVWKGAATKLGQCLAGLGVQGADNLVTAWMGGEAVDAAAIGWDLLPGFLDCATRFGAYVFTGLVPVTTRDSVGATMTPTARMLSALQEQGDPLALCGPRDGPPRCVIILPAP